MAQSGLSSPAKACHNCRRRRWKCDRSLPVCQKCLLVGSECLGYGKLFVWNRGVASRGKMMGKTFEESDSVATGIVIEKPTLLVRGPPESYQHGNAWPTYSITQTQTGQTTLNHLHRTYDSAFQVIKCEPSIPAQVQRPLVDPFMKDLDGHSRSYLVHFATRLASDMVAYDEPGQNPFRDLVSATSGSPFLLQIMIANAALHTFNIRVDTVASSAIDRQREHSSYQKAVTLKNGPNQPFFRDALTAKQKALSLLAQSVTAIDGANFDLVLAAILLFVNYDLIESGTDKWKVHMDGARKLISLLDDPSYQSGALSRLRITLLSDFLVFYILGSTFCFTYSPKLFPDTIQVEPIFKYAETNNYLSCPAPLLRIMLESFNLSESQDSPESLSLERQEKVKALLQKALSFDPNEWLSTFRPSSPSEDLSKRMHIASAHRSAVCIYLARFIPYTNPLLDPSGGTAVVSLTGLANEVIFHISHLGLKDNLFKSISWPLFLAGAEIDDLAQRNWVMNTLDRFYSLLHWGYIRTVQKVLEAIWTFKTEGATCWVTEVGKLGTEMLIA